MTVSFVGAASAEATLASQTLTLTENSVYVEVQPPTFDSQSLTLTLNGVSLSTSVDATLASQTLNLTLRSVSLSTNNYIDLTSQVLTSTLNSVSLNLDTVLTAGSQTMLLTERSVALITDQNIAVSSQTIHTTLNSLREWYEFSTAQPGNCPDHCDGLWVDIAFDEEVFGDDFAIASQPIGCLPQILPPIRKYPGTPWGSIATNTTTTWTNIPT